MIRHTRFTPATLILALVLPAGSARAARICVDPGHGGTDPGAVGFGYEEADFNLSEGIHLRTWLDADTRDAGGGTSWTVLMTRTEDAFVSLQGRCDIANNNGADRFLSIHNNCCGGNGTETYCYRGGSAASFDLRNKVNEEVVEHLGTADRGVKTADFYVLIHTVMPAELVEGVFMDTWDGNCALMSQDTYRSRIGLAHLHAAQRHFGYAPYTPAGVDPTSLPAAGGGTASLLRLGIGLGIAGAAFAYRRARNPGQGPPS